MKTGNGMDMGVLESQSRITCRCDVSKMLYAELTIQFQFQEFVMVYVIRVVLSLMLNWCSSSRIISLSSLHLSITLNKQRTKLDRRISTLLPPPEPQSTTHHASTGAAPYQKRVLPP